jgi:PIN domain nuclease of toxin-antitoxin system
MTAEFLVTDTHPLIYYFCGPSSKLSAKARAAFESATRNMSTSIYVPAPVIWELAMLVEKGTITPSKPFSEWIDELFQYPAFIPQQFDFDTVKILFGMNFHNDPFDKAIVATALQLQLPLISNNSALHEHKPCKLYWD